MMQTGQGTVVPPADCGEKAIAYINNNLVTQGTAVELVSITESKGLYELKSQYQSQDIALYTTKDCTLLFTNTLNMSTGSGVQQTPQATTAPVKSARPAVDLYVMSFCPYGTQAETVMSPVVDLLKIESRYPHPVHHHHYRFNGRFCRLPARHARSKRRPPAGLHQQVLSGKILGIS